MLSSLTRQVAALGAAVLFSTLVLFAASPAQAGAGSYAETAERATNAVRVQHGVRRAKGSDCLRRYAVRQAAKMAARRTIYHQDLGAVLRGCDLSYAGENVAVGFGTGRSVVRQGWMRSAGHRRNILDPRFRKVEVAARKGSDGQWYVAQVFGRR
ncbi:MAG TPA: CAP domain-containing protein [Nocardioides sp.]|uniref:CAP domain-containing protein n=1 Tax=Nocardioides sp. TaxID=35761 RepID=UPI002EDB14CC